MTIVHRVLHASPITSLAEYFERGGGRGIEAAAGLRPQRIIALVRASGLRGRGGAGYLTGRKWQTVARNRSPVEPSTVVVNGAEGVFKLSVVDADASHDGARTASSDVHTTTSAAAAHVAPALVKRGDDGHPRLLVDSLSRPDA